MAHFDRQLELWRLLRGAPDGMGLKALAERLGVSKNTVQRDLDELSQAGVPVRERLEGNALRFSLDEAQLPAIAAGSRELDARFEPASWRRTGFGVSEERPREVVVRFAPEVAHLVAERRWHPSQRLDHGEDGSLTLRARLSGENQFLGWVLSWSPFAELIAPADWRHELARRARRMANAHRGVRSRAG